jgi:DNA-directed RNA polymerase subunit RPC12/RpoP
MKKSDYQFLICGHCGLELLIPTKQYDKTHLYTCPLCPFKNVVKQEDLQPVKPFRQQPVIAERE